MMQCGERLRLAFEARQTIRIARDRVGEDLDCNRAIQSRVAGTIDFAHAAGAERRDDFICPESSTDRQGHPSALCVSRSF